MAARFRKPIVDPDQSKRRLRRTMLLTLALVALPMAVIIARTYSQLGEEGRFRDRRAAEEVAAQFDRQLFELLKPEEDRPFEDYQFLRPLGAGLQLSPLAQPGARPPLPGLVGYFEIQPGGQLTSPLLPENETAEALRPYGIDPAELERRRETLRSLHGLVSSVKLSQLREAQAKALPASLAASAGPEKAKKESLLPAQAKMASRNLEDRSPRRSVVNYLEDLSGVTDPRKKAVEQAAPEADMMADEAEFAAPAAAADAMARPGSTAGFGGAAGGSGGGASLGALQAAAPPVRGEGLKVNEQENRNAGRDAGAAKPPAVTQFLAVIDPFQATLLGAENLLFFRRVSRDERLFVQGFVVSAGPFVRALAEGSFLTSALAAGAGLDIESGSRTLGSFAPGGSTGISSYSNASGQRGRELARFPVSPPLKQVELVFTGGQGESTSSEVLLHVLTATVALVLLLGFWSIYRSSAAQIDLAAERSDFVSAVSHELKTPLTSIRMYAEMLKSGMAEDPAKQATYFDFILSESERLSRLIGNVLQLAKLSKGVPIAEPKPVAAGPLFDRVAAKATVQAKAAGFTLAIEADPAAANSMIAADEDCFTQIVLNLVDNALKFSSQAPEKRVELGLRVEPGAEKRIACAVRDFGPGVPKEERRKIFQLFYRAENELTRRTPGTGIGLALVTQLAGAMGASVDMCNREPSGAEFRVIFPRR